MQSSQGAGRQRFWFLLVTMSNLFCGHCIHRLQVVLRFHTVVLPHMQPVPAYNEPSDTSAQYVKSNLDMCHRSKILWHKQLLQPKICGPLVPQGSSVFCCSYFWHLSTKKTFSRKCGLRFDLTTPLPPQWQWQSIILPFLLLHLGIQRSEKCRPVDDCGLADREQ